MKAAAPQPDLVTAWARLHRVSREGLERVEAALKAAGLPPLAWYDALHEIAEAGDEPLRPFQLGDRLLLAQYNVSRLLARLEADGLIERSGVVEDGRGQSLRITTKGRAVRRRMWAVYGPMIGELVAGRLTPAEVQTLAALLAKLRS